MKKIFNQTEEEKRTILEMHKTAIFNNFLNESEVEEGSTWEGIKGLFRGKGYYYTKYLSEIQGVLRSLKIKIAQDKKLESQLSGILEKVTTSSMEDTKRDELINLLTQIDNEIVSATQRLEDRIQDIENLKR
jgi:succinate dehydrogenase flavin-adding protein (antitoxin of CptAB toxin-antitoxin module)